MRTTATYRVTLLSSDGGGWEGTVIGPGWATTAYTYGDLTPRGAARRMVADHFTVSADELTFTDETTDRLGRPVYTLTARVEVPL